jgi:hypothetical protein
VFFILTSRRTYLGILQQVNVLLGQFLARLIVVHTLIFMAFLELLPNESGLHRFYPRLSDGLVPRLENIWVGILAVLKGSTSEEYPLLYVSTASAMMDGKDGCNWKCLFGAYDLLSPIDTHAQPPPHILSPLHHHLAALDYIYSKDEQTRNSTIHIIISLPDF